MDEILVDEDWLAYECDLENREQEIRRIIAKVRAYLTPDELATLEYECGITRKTTHKD